MIAAGTRLLSWTLCQRCCVGDPPSQVPRSRCTSSLATISGFIIAQRSRCARPCAVFMARRSWWRSRSIGECLEPHSPLPVPYRGRAVGVIYRVPAPPRWQVQLCGPRSSSSKLDFLAGQRPPSLSPTPSTSSRNDVCSCLSCASATTWPAPGGVCSVSLSPPQVWHVWQSTPPRCSTSL